MLLGVLITASVHRNNNIIIIIALEANERKRNCAHTPNSSDSIINSAIGETHSATAKEKKKK